MNKEEIENYIAELESMFELSELEEHSRNILKVGNYIKQLQQENKELKEDISFCLHSIKQEMEMSTDSRTRSEMTSCYEILKRWNK